MAVYTCSCGAQGNGPGTCHGQPMTATTAALPALPRNGSDVALTTRGPRR